MIFFLKYKSLIKLSFISVLVILCSITYAQTEPMYSQYMNNLLVVNPAYAGNREVLGLNLYQRIQWSNINGAPTTSSFSLDNTFDNKKAGWGVQLFNDKLGVEKATGSNFLLSSKVKITDEGFLSGGMSIGLMNYRISLTDVSNRFTVTDPAFYGNLNKWLPNLGFGLFYNTEKYYAGISIPNILRSRLNAFDVMQSGVQKFNSFHLFVNAGIVFEVNDDVKIKPSTMLKAISGSPLQMDLNTNVYLKDVFGFGVSYRTGDAIVSIVEYQATENFKVGYSYDITMSPLKYYSNGTHEFALRYEIGTVKTKVKSTRYF